MADDSQVTDKGWDNLSPYAAKSSEADDAVTVSISTTPGEWLVNTVDSVVVPMSMAELVELLRAGKLTERSLVWRIGMQEWAHVEKVPQLRLAARLPSRAPSSSPSATRTKPPPKPVRPTPVPQVGLSRRSTLPFGMPAPKVPLPRPAILPTPAADEPALAVYARPAATISFDLSADSVRGPVPSAPGTLAPTTSDAVLAAPSPSTPRSDLSVVAAAQFRATQRSAKRLVVTCSVASAAAASLLTFWLARGAAPAPTPRLTTAPGVTRAAEPVAATAPPAPAAAEQPATLAPTMPEQSSVNRAALEAPSAAPAPSTPKAKPRKARVVRAQPIARPPESEPDPSSQPNPYAAKLEQDGQSEGQKPAPVPASAASEKTAAEPPAEADSSQQVLDLTQ